MQILIGMILLLQLVILIQIMQTKKQMLQLQEMRLEKMNEPLNKESADLENACLEKRENNFERSEEERKTPLNSENKKSQQEILLQEVLSEVFS